MDEAIVLTISDLTVPNKEDCTANRLVPRPLSIDGLQLCLTARQRVLLVAGWGAGKSTLMETPRRGHPRVSIASVYRVIEVDGETSPSNLDPAGIYIKDNFDPAKHKGLVEACKTTGCTLLVASEIDKLPAIQRNDFDRVVVIDEGRIVADQVDAGFESKLVRWIDKYARDRSRHLRKDSKFLRDYFGLQLESAWPDCP